MPKMPEDDEPRSAKVVHVKAARQTRDHGCHWPGCGKQVKPVFWGCFPHWMTLPKDLRDRIWDAYRSGQEVDMTPSKEYLEAAEAVQNWIREHLKKEGKRCRR